jgi:hypothetical protein
MFLAAIIQCIEECKGADKVEKLHTPLAQEGNLPEGRMGSHARIKGCVDPEDGKNCDSAQCIQIFKVLDGSTGGGAYRMSWLHA